ncbi:MAG: nucleoside hydrolase, partial [Fervidobacterium sp.]
MRKIIIDTDAGVDDTLAIIYVAASAMNEIEFISTVSGNVHVDSVTKNVALISNLIGAGFPVYKGSAKPLQGRLTMAPEVHGPDGIGGYRSTDEIAPLNQKSGIAPLKIAQAAAKYGKSLTIISLGPMTNIAKALRADSNSLRQVKEVVQMGGVFYGYGNTTTFTE